MSDSFGERLSEAWAAHHFSETPDDLPLPPSYLDEAPPADDPYYEIRPQPKANRSSPIALPEPIWFDEITPQLDQRDFVKGVLFENSATVVYGDSNCGKTFFTADLALHVAAGMEWNGRRVEQGAVIYCVLEGGSGFQNRVAAWKEQHCLEGKRIPFAALSAQVNLLDPEAHTGPLIAVIKSAAERAEMPVKLVVIDTLSRALAGGNENASEDMGHLVMNIDRIRAETGAAVLLVHHSGKDATRGARGWSGLRAAVDTEIEIDSEEDSNVRTVKLRKQRETGKEDQFRFTLDVRELGVNRHGEPVTTCVVKYSLDRAPRKTKSADKIGGHPGKAYEILCDLIVSEGVKNLPGVPEGIRAIKARTWRHRVYDRTAPDVNMEAKKRSFTRAQDKLIEFNRVACANGHVWVVRRMDDDPGGGESLQI